MTVVQTVLIYGAIPLAVIVLVGLGVYGRSAVHQPNRYRPGKPWDHAPVWYVPHPVALENVVADRPALPGASATTAAGGASGEW